MNYLPFQAYKTDTDITPNFDANTANAVSKIQLTRTEFADALGLKPTSMFVRNMFLMVDKDRNGFVSFQEFMEMFTILAKGQYSETLLRTILNSNFTNTNSSHMKNLSEFLTYV